MYSFNHFPPLTVQNALEYLQTSLILQKMSQTGDDSILARGAVSVIVDA